MAQCPVDHSSSSSSSSSSASLSSSNPSGSAEKCPVDHSQLAHSSDSDSCPADHKTRSTWTNLLPSLSHLAKPATAEKSASSLPTSRQTSSIPRAGAAPEGENAHWVYPSEAQFFAAMARKRHEPQAKDMRVVVPIHNAVNERAWGEVLGWESGWGGERCGGVKLVSFKGRPEDRSPRAWMKMLLGYQAPFDRHDWVIDRCGTRMRYVIDFYTGKSRSASDLAFYLDVRPALDNWEGVKMRASKTLERWIGPLPWRNAARNDSKAER